MKFLYILLFFLISHTLLGQDKLYKRNNSVLDVKILLVTQDSVKYSKSNKTFAINKSEVTMIIYEDGSTEVFTNSASQIKTETESKTKTKKETKETAKDKAKSDADAKAKTDAKAKAEADAKEKAKAEAKAKADAERKAKVAAAGPSNLFFSLMVPGWGDYKVRENKKPYWLLAAGAYGLIGAGVFFKIQSNQTYQLYLNKLDDNISEYKRNTYYTDANNKHHAYYILTKAGAAIWLGDIILVAVKGIHNKKSNTNLSSTKQSFYLGFNPQTKSPLLVYKINF